MRLTDLLRAPALVWQATVSGLPGPAGDRLRAAYWRRRLGHLGTGVRIGPGAMFQNPEHVYLGDGCWIDRNVLVLAGPPRPGRRTHVQPLDGFPLQPGDVHIGAGTHIAPNCVLSGMGGLAIGRRSGIAANSSIFSLVHHHTNLSDPTDRRQYLCTPRVDDDLQAMLQSPVWIEDDCGVGANSVLLPGTHLKRGTWLAAATVARGALGPQAVVQAMPRTIETRLGLGLPE